MEKRIILSLLSAQHLTPFATPINPFYTPVSKNRTYYSFTLGGGRAGGWRHPQQCTLSISNSFHPIFTKLGQKLYLDNI
ncbi:hypothetical protein DPMN_062195 [Dreissena polymorpha]|uniref:Uncharacterized protein n=1 Tax=Dreissena polymorpha TaxID=45954 RepID=A0A9D4C8E5_DREPO|nr:hypothetical protein DPMN_062195 [Dreissena polymorpha]